MMSVGYVVVLGLGLFLPVEDYDPSLKTKENNLAEQANKQDIFWRWIYLVPCMINIYMLIVFCVFIREDSVIFNLSQGNDDNAFRLIRKIYGRRENHKYILKQIKS